MIYPRVTHIRIVPGNCIEMEIENENSQMHGEHLLPSSWNWSPSRESFIIFQALLGLWDTFQHTNMKRSSKDMIAGIQIVWAFLCFANMPIFLYQLEWSAGRCRFLYCLFMAYKRPKCAKMGTCHTPSCTQSSFSLIGKHAFRKKMVLVSKIICAMLFALLPWTRCEKSRISL